MSGDPTRARRAFAPLVARADDAGWTPGLAARVASLHYMCGEFESALDVLDRCSDLSDPGAAPPDGEELVDWWACRVHVLAMLGRPRRRRPPRRGVSTPPSDSATHARSESRTSPSARTCRGTLKDLHHDQALGYAAQADDVVTATRALAAHTCRLLAAARYDQACVSAREAARMARLSCPPGLQAAALHNLGEALARTGELDEALWHLECSVALCRRLGPARAALGLVGTSPTSTGRWGTRSRAAPPTPRRPSSPAAPATCRCSCRRCRVRPCSQPTSRRREAENAAAEARRLAPHDLLPVALTTTGRVAVIRGDRAAAAEHARRAVAAAREVRAADLLADALELEATVVDDPARAREALTEALSIWSAGGAGPAVARVEVLIGRLPDADGTERSRARDAARTLRRLGIHVLDGRAVRRRRRRRVRLRRGPGTVHGHGGGRGGAATRLAVATGADAGQDPGGAPGTGRDPGSTLRPALAGRRSGTHGAPALGPARHRSGRARPGEGVATGPLHHGGPVRRCASTSAPSYSTPTCCCATPRTRPRSSRAETPSGRARCWRTWTSSTAARRSRTSPRSGPTACARRSGRPGSGRCAAWPSCQSREGRGAEALGIFVRLLAIDPYDEQVHRRLVASLVRAGRHGEARRAFDRWCQAMQEIDAPLPDPRAVEPDLGDARAAAVLTPR